VNTPDRGAEGAVNTPDRGADGAGAVVLLVNGRSHIVTAAANETLLEVLRERLGLTGTKHGCELGECGACTVLVDGEPMLACLLLTAQLEGRAITTVEGLGAPGVPHALQTAFADLGAAQCGYCTPGMLLSAAALLEEIPDPDVDQVAAALAGNLCRCTGYTKILEAVMAAASQRLASAP
jgi:carbon-monoxide dehydrogenase small subunit